MTLNPFTHSHSIRVTSPSFCTCHFYVQDYEVCLKYNLQTKQTWLMDTSSVIHVGLDL